MLPAAFTRAPAYSCLGCTQAPFRWLQRDPGGAGGAGIATQEDEGARRQPAAVDAGGEEYINTSILYYYQGGPQGPNPASPAHGFYIDFEF